MHTPLLLLPLSKQYWLLQERRLLQSKPHGGPLGHHEGVQSCPGAAQCFRNPRSRLDHEWQLGFPPAPPVALGFLQHRKNH